MATFGSSLGYKTNKPSIHVTILNDLTKSDQKVRNTCQYFLRPDVVLILLRLSCQSLVYANELDRATSMLTLERPVTGRCSFSIKKIHISFITTFCTLIL
jgi:hypothetical protein